RDVQRRTSAAVANVHVSRLDQRQLAARGRSVQPGVAPEFGLAWGDLGGCAHANHQEREQCASRELQAATASSIRLRAAASNAAASADRIKTRAARGSCTKLCSDERW